MVVSRIDDSGKKGGGGVHAPASRGTTDELEVLKEILENNKELKIRVLDALRKHKLKSQETIFDVVKEKKKASSKNYEEE